VMLAQIAGYRPALPLQEKEEDQCRDRCDGRMDEAGQPRYGRKHNPVGGDVVKPVLVPARQFPPAVMRSLTL
jgi:hypothetical protein